MSRACKVPRWPTVEQDQAPREATPPGAWPWLVPSTHWKLLHPLRHPPTLLLLQGQAVVPTVFKARPPSWQFREFSEKKNVGLLHGAESRNFLYGPRETVEGVGAGIVSAEGQLSLVILQLPPPQPVPD